jgi:hypothetical protein
MTHSCKNGHPLHVWVAAYVTVDDIYIANIDKQRYAIDVYCENDCPDDQIDPNVRRRVSAIALGAIDPHLPNTVAVRHCRSCGCTEPHVCEDGCTWAEPDLCSRCTANSVATCAGSTAA